MYKAFAHDLKVARRKSGLSQRDCGHLLAISQQRISQLETGRDLPTIPEICSLSLIYGRSFESLFGSVFDEVRKQISEQLTTLPNSKKGWIERFNRHSTLNRLAARLNDHNLFGRGSL